MKPNPNAEQLSLDFGYSETLFIDRDFLVITGENKKKVLEQTARAGSRIIIYKATSEEMLRFVLEKTKVQIIFGMEGIYLHDSLHFVRGGLDQVLCKIAKERNKTIGFSFKEIQESKNRDQLLARMMFNLNLCKKYSVKTLLLCFFTGLKEFRSAHDLEALWQVLHQGERNIYK